MNTHPSRTCLGDRGPLPPAAGRQEGRGPAPGWALRTGGAHRVQRGTGRDGKAAGAGPPEPGVGPRRRSGKQQRRSGGVRGAQSRGSKGKSANPLGTSVPRARRAPGPPACGAHGALSPGPASPSRPRTPQPGCDVPSPPPERPRLRPGSGRAAETEGQGAGLARAPACRVQRCWPGLPPREGARRPLCRPAALILTVGAPILAPHWVAGPGGAARGTGLQALGAKAWRRLELLEERGAPCGEGRGARSDQHRELRGTPPTPSLRPARPAGGGGSALPGRAAAPVTRGTRRPP